MESERVLMLYDRKYNVSFITQFESFNSHMELIKKLRDPHARVYEFRCIYLEDLDEIADENAFDVINTANVPHPFDFGRKIFVESFNLLWPKGKEVF